MKIGTFLSLSLSIYGVVLHFVDISAAKNYCAASLCRESQHIACNNTGALDRFCPRGAELPTLTAAIKSAIVDIHNIYRNTIAQGGFSHFAAAARMATMKWNAELAKIATYNVKQCTFKTDACRNTHAFKYVGQSLAYIGWSDGNYTVQDIALKSIDSFFDENKDCTMKQINKYTSPPRGVINSHFTQMVQQKATDIGCAILRQMVTSDGIDFTEQYMTCNYARTNILHTPVYVTATIAASKCTTGVNPTYKYLCSLKESYKVNAP